MIAVLKNLRLQKNLVDTEVLLHSIIIHTPPRQRELIRVEVIRMCIACSLILKRIMVAQTPLSLPTMLFLSRHSPSVCTLCGSSYYSEIKRIYEYIELLKKLSKFGNLSNRNNVVITCKKFKSFYFGELELLLIKF